MNTKKPSFPSRLFVPVGLLLVIAPTLMRDGFNVPIPDFLRGMLAGTGLALEVFGIVIMKKRSDSRI